MATISSQCFGRSALRGLVAALAAKLPLGLVGGPARLICAQNGTERTKNWTPASYRPNVLLGPLQAAVVSVDELTVSVTDLADPRSQRTCAFWTIRSLASGDSYEATY